MRVSPYILYIYNSPWGRMNMLMLFEILVVDQYWFLFDRPLKEFEQRMLESVMIHNVPCLLMVPAYHKAIELKHNVLNPLLGHYVREGFI